MSSAVRQLIEATGKYEILHENTEGMNAEAFTARHVPLGTNVFLKAYFADGRSSEVFREPRLLVEATSGNPPPQNLVSVRDAETLGTEYVLVAMELVGGGSLLQALQRGGLGQVEAIRLTVGILHGVAHLHSRDLVHRDLKPANILLDGSGALAVPRIGDFGSVARLSVPDGQVTASKHSALYVPPEGWQTPSTYGKPSDLYQVGMVLHELVNGPLPYNDCSAYLDRQAKREIRGLGATQIGDLHAADACAVVDRAIARRASSGRLLELSPELPYVSPRLRRVIAKATSPDLSRRYQTATQFIGDLERLALPNWLPSDQDGVYLAADWRGWDWRIEPGTPPNETMARKARSGSTNYRKWRVFDTVHDAVKDVESFG